MCTSLKFSTFAYYLPNITVHKPVDTRLSNGEPASVRRLEDEGKLAPLHSCNHVADTSLGGYESEEPLFRDRQRSSLKPQGNNVRQIVWVMEALCYTCPSIWIADGIAEGHGPPRRQRLWSPHTLRARTRWSVWTSAAEKLRGSYREETTSLADQ